MDLDDIVYPNIIEGQIKYFNNNSEVNYFFRNYGIQHPETMIKKEFIEKLNIKYNESYKKLLDYDLFVECSKYTHANLIRLERMQTLIHECNENDKELHLKLCNNELDIPIIELNKWVKKLIKSNRKKRIYKQDLFERELKNICLNTYYYHYKNRNSKKALMFF